MATQVQFRRGTTSQNNAFTGAQGELTIDTDVYTIRIHDGTTAGGRQVPTLTATQTFTNKTMGSSSVWNGNAIGLGYGGTGAALTGVAGAVVYSTGSAMALSLAGTSGQVLTSGGSSGPTWVSASALSTGTATTATTATNIAGGSAGYLVYQQDTNTTNFIAPGDSGFILRSTGASTAPSWVTSALTIGSTPAQVGDTTTSFAGVRSITMGNGSYGGGTVGSTITGSGPWTATVTGISSTTGINVGQNITATPGTGSFFGGSPTSVVVASIVSGTSITITVTGGTTPTAGTVTSITTLGFLQVPTGTTAQRPWVPANGMIRYNSTQSTFEGYSSSAWSSLGGVKSVDGYTYIQAETSAGAGNGDLDFYAENSGGNGATQVGQWNRTNLKEYTGTIVGTQTTQNVFNATATTVNAFGAATTLTIGATSGTTTVRNDLTITGNLTVNGTTTTVNATTITVDDKNIELGSVATPSDITADGGGITLKGATDKTLNWVSSTNAWTSSEDFNLVTGKVYEIAGTSVLSATTLGSGVTGSSLTSVGTIGTGTWQGTVVAGQYGGTGVNNSGKTITIGGNFTTSGAHTTTLTTTANTSVTLPTTGTLATLAGSETFTNKTLTFPIIDNIRMGFTSTATAAGTTTLTATSNLYQRFTGTTTQTIVLPVTSTLATGVAYEIENTSTGNLTVNSSGGNLVATVIPGTTVQCMCIGTSNTTAADWDPEYTEFATITGTGSVALSASPTFTGTLTAATVSATTLTETSDERLKSDITPLTNALEIVQQLEGKAFIKDNKASIGLIAQQVQQVLPQVVVTADDEMKTLSVQYGNIVAVLIEAVKEQQKQIEELKAKLG
jgi:hypothetical protein